MFRFILGVFVMGGIVTEARGQPRSLLDDPTAWKSISSDGVKTSVTAEANPAGGKSLRIDYDFSAGAGYGGAVLELPTDLPDNYQFTFTVRGTGPANNLELKLVDPSKLNVWWVNRRAFEWPAEPTRLVNQRRHFHFAWGPSGGAEMRKLGHVEVIIAANEGGRGTVWIDDFRYSPLPPSRPYAGTPKFSASSGDATQLPWRAEAHDAAPALAVDFGEPREIGGIVVTPAAGALGNCDVEVSDDGATWQTLRKIRNAGPLPLAIQLTDLQTRHLRLKFNSPTAAVGQVEFLEPAVGASPNSFWQFLASRAPRGVFPRNLIGQQSFWTVIGQPDDDREALVNEEGQIEVDRKGFSIEPFIVRDGRLLTWADGKHEQSLRDGWIPMPTVVRRHDGIELSITALAAGEPGATALHAAYTIKNTSTTPARGRLVLAIRPMQVLPPWQDLNITGGWTAVQSVRRDGDAVIVNESRGGKRIVADGFSFSAATMDAGEIVALLSAGAPLPSSSDADCPQRSASAAMSWEFDLPPGAAMTRVISTPFHPDAASPTRPMTDLEFAALADRVAADWVAAVDRARFRLPHSAQQFADTLRATQAYILINHDGQGFQPGSRTYNRSWMRDGSMTSAAMLELGHDDLVQRFIDWYAPHQFPSGKVPCVVDSRGADPVDEHDSHGQLLWLIANYHRYTNDTELVRRHFDRVKSAVGFIESLRAQRLTEEFSASGPPRQEPGKPPVPALAFRGLVPESISHEGYSAKPMHSYWDTFFILRGLEDAAYLAGVVGDAALASRWRQLTDDFRQCLLDSIRLCQQAHGIDYLPGCVELGDFDSTSSTILLWPVDQASYFPREWIDATFNRYWSNFVQRREQDPPQWTAYTPYELRHVGALVRLGQKQRAWDVLRWYMSHQRPAGWRHWAEVVHREPTTPRMIGDMPHTWCGSDFLNSARAMFVYEDHAGQKLILLAGTPDEWASDTDGFAFTNLRTEHGPVSAEVRPRGQDIVITLAGGARPPGGVVVCSPVDRPIRSARIDGQEAPIDGQNRIHVDSAEATIELSY